MVDFFFQNKIFSEKVNNKYYNKWFFNFLFDYFHLRNYRPSLFGNPVPSFLEIDLRRSW